jgi:hypothetical protein
MKRKEEQRRERRREKREKEGGTCLMRVSMWVWRVRDNVSLRVRVKSYLLRGS